MTHVCSASYKKGCIHMLIFDMVTIYQ